jgi:hypothetical protein
MAYDPHTGKVEDFGIGPRFEGMNTGAYDPKFNRIYGLTHPRGHFIYYDAGTGAKVDKGRMNNWDSICRTLGIDDQGNVYGSFGAGRIYQYDPRTDTIRELDAKLPVRNRSARLRSRRHCVHWRKRAHFQTVSLLPGPVRRLNRTYLA